MKQGIFFVLFCGYILLQGQNYRFKKLTTADGLSQNSVNDMYQDSAGYIWLGTQDGLNFFDGVSFEHFRYIDNQSPIHDNFIIQIQEDRHNNLWLSHRRGISIFSKKDHTGKLVKPISGMAYQPAHSLELVDNNIELIDFRFNYYKSRYIPQSDSILLEKQALDKEFGTPFYIFNPSFAKRLIITSRGLLIYRKSQTPTFVSYPKSMDKPLVDINYGILEDEEGNLWFTLKNQLLKFNISSNEMQVVSVNPHQKVLYQDLEIDKSGKLWVGTDNGIYILKDGEVVCHISYNPENKKGLSYGLIHALLLDKQNQMWVGTANEGLNIYNPEIEQFRFLNQYFGIKDPTIWSICKEGKELLLGTTTGLARVTLKNENINHPRFLADNIKSIRFIPVLEKNKILSISQVNGNYWIGTNNGLVIFDNDFKNIRAKINFVALGFKNNLVTDIIPYNGEVYVSTFRGVYRFNPIDYSFKKATNLETAYVFDMYQQENRLWLCTTNGIWKYNLDSKSVKKYSYDEGKVHGKGPSFKFIAQLDADQVGNLWIATFGGGLNKFDIKKEQFTQISEREGLANNVLASVAVVENGVWMSHNQGISFYNFQNRKVTNYNVDDGVVFNEFAISSSFKDSLGNVYFGSIKGINVIDSKSFEFRNDFNSKVELRKVIINYGNVPSEKRWEINEKQLVLQPGDKIFDVELSVLDFKNSGIRIEYKLEGFDGKWRMLESGTNSLAYSNLDPGLYTLKVRAIDKNGNRSSFIETLNINVLTPLWKKWWFILFIAVVLITLVSLISRYFAQRKLKEKLIQMEADRKLFREKQRISKDLHDNVGSNITYLIHALDNLSYKLTQSEMELLVMDIDELSDDARSTMDMLRETIWAVNKDRISQKEFETRLNFYAHKMLDIAKIDCEVEIVFKEGKILSPFLAVNILRIIQEALNNVVKHSRASKVEVLVMIQDTIEVSVKDDGIGFNPDKNEQEGHYGLENLKSRAKDIGGELIISTSEKGTEVILTA